MWRSGDPPRCAGSGPRTAGRQDLPLDEGLLEPRLPASEGFAGAEIEQSVVDACFDALPAVVAAEENDLVRSIDNLVPLAVTQAEQIMATRDWAAARAVFAATRRRIAATTSVVSRQSRAMWRKLARRPGDRVLERTRR